jgi:sarcosine oxidase, subunit delta
MKLMTCPINGRRAISEFAYGGELREMPDPARASDRVWADYVFNRSGVPGVKKEWWCHTPSGVWFIAERDTTTDEILQTYLYRPPDTSSKHGASQPAVSEHGS